MNEGEFVTEARNIIDVPWNVDGFIEWGKYLIAAIENNWDDDLVLAINEFTELYGRREEDDDNE